MCPRRRLRKRVGFLNQAACETHPIHCIVIGMADILPVIRVGAGVLQTLCYRGEALLRRVPAYREFPPDGEMRACWIGVDAAGPLQAGMVEVEDGVVRATHRASTMCFSGAVLSQQALRKIDPVVP